MALDKQTISIPVAGGLDTKTDDKQVMAGKALVLENARFQKTGKLSKRFGLVALPTTVNTGTISGAVAVVADNEFMALQGADGIYGYSSADQAWYKQSPVNNLAKIRTDYILDNFFVQSQVDMDVTSDGTHAAYVCHQTPPTGASFSKNISICLEDLTTGIKKYRNVIIASADSNLNRVLVVKDSGVVKVHVFYYDGTNVKRDIYDKNMDILSSGTTITTCTLASNFDVCKDTSLIFFGRITGTNLTLFSYNFAGTQQSTSSNTVSTTLRVTGGIGRGMNIIQTTNNVHVAWNGSGTNIKGFSKVLVANITESNIAGLAGLDKVQMCSDGTSIFLFSDTDSSSQSELYFNNLSFGVSYGAGSVSTVYRCAISAQPFIYLGNVYIPLRSPDFNNQSFFLYDTTNDYICQKFSPELSIRNTLYGSPLQPESMASKSTIISGVSRFGIVRRSSDSESDTLQTPGMSVSTLDFVNTYKSFSRVKVGTRIYLTNGSTIECDKSNPTDNGFVFNPVLVSVVQQTGTPNANVASKTFSYQLIYSYKDSDGNISRSAPSAAISVTTNANASGVIVTYKTTLKSLKCDSAVTRFSQLYAVEIYRTESVDPTTAGSVFYKVLDAIATAEDGSTNAIVDTAADSSITSNGTIYVTGGVLQNDSAPTARFSWAGGNRIFLGGLENKDEISYSKKQLTGESVNFSELFTIRVASGKSDKSDVTAGGYMDGKIIIFRSSSIYFVQGDGPNELGVGGFSDPEPISTDAGCDEPRSVLETPNGLMFKSSKGIYLLSRGMQVSYIGAPVEDFNSQNIVSSLLSKDYNEARFYTNAGNCLVYNYLFDSWSVFKSQTAIDASLWQGNPVSLLSNKVFQETANTYLDNGAAGFYSMKFTSPWLKLDLVQGYIRCYQLWIIGSFKSLHTLKCRIYIDYDDSTYEDYSLVYDGTDASQYQFQVSIPKQKVESMKFEIYDASWTALSTGEAYDLSNIQVEIGIKSGGYKLAASKSY